MSVDYKKEHVKLGLIELETILFVDKNRAIALSEIANIFPYFHVRPSLTNVNGDLIETALIGHITNALKWQIVPVQINDKLALSLKDFLLLLDYLVSKDDLIATYLTDLARQAYLDKAVIEWIGSGSPVNCTPVRPQLIQRSFKKVVYYALKSCGYKASKELDKYITKFFEKLSIKEEYIEATTLALLDTMQRYLIMSIRVNRLDPWQALQDF